MTDVNMVTWDRYATEEKVTNECLGGVWSKTVSPFSPLHSCVVSLARYRVYLPYDDLFYLHCIFLQHNLLFGTISSNSIPSALWFLQVDRRWCFGLVHNSGVNTSVPDKSFKQQLCSISQTRKGHPCSFLRSLSLIYSCGKKLLLLLKTPPPPSHMWGSSKWQNGHRVTPCICICILSNPPHRTTSFFLCGLAGSVARDNFAVLFNLCIILTQTIISLNLTLNLSKWFLCPNLTKP